MEHRMAPSGSLSRAGRTLLLAGSLLILEMCAGDREASAEQGADLSGLVPQFNGICGELTRARDELRSGRMDEEAFADLMLALFVTADSLQCSLATHGAAARRAGGPLFAIDRALRSLIDSIRENYVGIVARNGVSFVAADRALQAAVSWRSGAFVGLEPAAPARP